jgi:hypothetical protein
MQRNVIHLTPPGTGNSTRHRSRLLTAIAVALVGGVTFWLALGFRRRAHPTTSGVQLRGTLPASPDERLTSPPQPGGVPDPAGSCRIVWMINRMIKQARRSTSRVMCLGSGPRGWVQRFGSPACVVFAMGTLFTSILKPAKQVDIAYQGRTSLAVRRVSWAHERDNHLVTHSLAVA